MAKQVTDSSGATYKIKPPFYKNGRFWTWIVTIALSVGGFVYVNGIAANISNGDGDSVNIMPKALSGNKATKDNFDKIVLGDDAYGTNGTTIAEAEKLLGNPTSKQMPNEDEIKRKEKIGIVPTAILSWDENKDTSKGKYRSEYGKGKIYIHFATKDGKADDARAVEKNENLQQDDK